MRCAVTGDVGECGPAMNLSVFSWLHNIETKRFFNTVKGTGPCLVEHGPAINLTVFTWLQNTHTKKFFNTVNRTGPCLKEHNPAVRSNVLERLQAIQTKKFFNIVKWAALCLGEHDHVFVWTLLHVCITSKGNDSSTPGNELRRDKGCWGARPNHQLKCF